MNVEQAMQLGCAQMQARLTVVAAAHGPEIAAAYAAGAANYARDFHLKVKGPIATYDWFAVLADQSVSGILARDHEV